MSDLITWLRAQLDHDERVEHAVLGVNVRADILLGKPVPRWRTREGTSEIESADGIARVGHTWAAEAKHITRWDPARVLAEVDVKRQILDAHGRPHECIALTGSGDSSVVDGEPWELWELAHTDDYGPCFVVRFLALPYADRDGYREEWRPTGP